MRKIEKEEVKRGRPSKKAEIKERDEFFKDLDARVEAVKESYKDDFNGGFVLINIPKMTEEDFKKFENEEDVKGQILIKANCNFYTLKTLINVLENAQKNLKYSDPMFGLQEMIKKMKEKLEEEEDEFKW